MGSVRHEQHGKNTDPKKKKKTDPVKQQKLNHDKGNDLVLKSAT